jgi:hypothetical protein
VGAFRALTALSATKTATVVFTRICLNASPLRLTFFTDEDSGVVDLIPSISATETIAEFPWVSNSTITHLRNAGLKVYLM